MDELALRKLEQSARMSALAMAIDLLRGHNGFRDEVLPTARAFRDFLADDEQNEAEVIGE